MTEFIQGGYNKHDHNHAEWTDDQLQDKLNHLHEIRSVASYGERRGQIDREMGMIAFEMSERLREARKEDIEAAWKYHEEHKEGPAVQP